MKSTIINISAIAVATVCLTGCGPDVESMQQGLVKSGLPVNQASCYAEKAAEDTPKDAYEYVANFLNAGVSEKDAINKARRKYGADFKTPLGEARKACVK